MPVLAVASGIAAASLAALPLTAGFFKDELFFHAASDSGAVVAALAVVAAALTFAYMGRFWLGLFTGRTAIAPRRLPATLVAPIAVLAVLTVAGGIVVAPFAELAAVAATVTHGAAVAVEPAYHVDLRTENVMAVAAWALGGGLLAVSGFRTKFADGAARLGDRLGPRHWYGLALAGLNGLSDRLHATEVHDLRTSLAAVLVPGGVLMALGFLATPTDGAYTVGALTGQDLPIVVLLALGVGAALTAARDHGRLRPVLALSVLGFALAAVYAASGAPDVALVAIVIETVLTLVFVAVFSRLPGTTVGGGGGPTHRIRNVGAGVVAGVSAFAVIWAELSRPPLGGEDSEELIRLTPAAHGGDVVTVILADFRGLDTMVEITVLAVAIIGVASLLRREPVR
jgi:multicomponent Na+:H+ antiporter subunit A